MVNEIKRILSSKKTSRKGRRNPLAFIGSSHFLKSRPGVPGQALVLLAVSFFALIAFIGLVTDVGSIYISYTQLQRAIDAAAVAAANNIKLPSEDMDTRRAKIIDSAKELLDLNNITGVEDMHAYLCNDFSHPGPASFQTLCAGDARKLVYIDATQDVPVYFLQIFGVRSVPISSHAIGETASVDLVLVFDTSESMGVNTTGYVPGDFDPSTCNTANNCQPLREAKDAAKSLVNNLFPGYDQVAIVTFSYRAQTLSSLPSLSSDLAAGGTVQTAIDNISLHDDAPANLVKWYQSSPGGTDPDSVSGYRVFNPINPEDRDGDGHDEDLGKPCTDEYVNNDDHTLGDHTPDMWDDVTGDPCDRDDQFDAFDWNRNGVWGDPEPCNPSDWTAGGDNCDPDSSTYEDTSLVSTCSGCGVRMATDVLKASGRRNSTWVIVFLSDGVANLSDDHASYSEIADVADFRYGFCGTHPDTAFWSTYCIDNNIMAPGRYCIDDNPDQCPPGSTPTSSSGPYSVEDYAYDMVDRAALRYADSADDHEPLGEDIVMFSIGLGSASAGENFLRYMANVGDDGSRAGDQCLGVDPLKNCGNYYYAPSAAYLSQIFENIAGRIYTKISQ